MDIGQQDVVVQNGPASTDQFEAETQSFQGSEEDFGRDEEMERWTVSTQVEIGTVGDRDTKNRAMQDMGQWCFGSPGTRRIHEQ